jgi:hypothetical protein
MSMAFSTRQGRVESGRAVARLIVEARKSGVELLEGVTLQACSAERFSVFELTHPRPMSCAHFSRRLFLVRILGLAALWIPRNH